jgi:hypothetical protein
MEEKDCNTQGCPVDCQVGDWGPWSTCPVCGPEPCTQSRTRHVTTPPSNGGLPCPSLEDVKETPIPVCPRDCLYTPWSDWSQCSKSCGGGVQHRTRNIYEHAAGTGKKCDVKEMSETRACGTNACNCQVGAWSSWSDCKNSKMCGTGSQERTRSITQNPTKGGQSCPDLKQTQNCTLKPCPIDCQVSDWGDWTCESDCRKRRYRNITVHPDRGGMKCPTLQEEKACDPGECDCQFSSFIDCNCCTAKGRYIFDIVRQPYRGGKACPTDLHPKEEVGCDPKNYGYCALEGMKKCKTTDPGYKLFHNT